MKRPWLARLLTLLTLTGACAGSTTPAAASNARYNLQVEDAHGHPLRSYWHRGQIYVLGRIGQRYVIRITNHTARRVEAVVSVDGRDVLTGQPGDFDSQRGYVIAPHASIRIEGFRKSLHGVAAFRFTTPGNSYSSRMGTPENVGIIGAAFFEERRRPPRRSGHLHIGKPHRKRGGARAGAEHAENSGAAPPASDSAREPSAPAGERHTRGRPKASTEAEARSHHGDGYAPYRDDHSHIGTEYGEHRRSEVREVRFVRHSPRHPTRVLTLRYDDARGLAERGIALHPPQPPLHGPQAFPVSRFAPPPPSRRGY